MRWLRELWRWLKIRVLKQPCSLVWVDMHCNVRLISDTSWRVKFYVDIVLVGRRLNLWCKPNSLQGEALICDKRCQPFGWLTCQLLAQMGSKMSKFKSHLTRCLTWYHAMDGLILSRSVMLWNHIAWTWWPIGKRGTTSRAHACNACYICNNAIVTIVIIAFWYIGGFVHPGRR